MIRHTDAHTQFTEQLPSPHSNTVYHFLSTCSYVGDQCVCVTDNDRIISHCHCRLQQKCWQAAVLATRSSRTQYVPAGAACGCLITNGMIPPSRAPLCLSSQLNRGAGAWTGWREESPPCPCLRGPGKTKRTSVSRAAHCALFTGTKFIPLWPPAGNPRPAGPASHFHKGLVSDLGSAPCLM